MSEQSTGRYTDTHPGLGEGAFGDAVADSQLGAFKNYSNQVHYSFI
jgi:hypothetical protein